MHCSPRILTFSSLLMGAVALCTLSLGVSTDYWVSTIEIHEVPVENKTTIETILNMRSGLWRMCLVVEDMPAQCWSIDYFKQDKDRDDDATIGVAITRAIRMSAPMQVGALVFVILGFVLGIIGGLKQDARTIAAAVMYIFSGLLVAVGMIFYISSINDEVGHGAKLKEGSSFKYTYGWSFIFVGISFVCSEAAAVLCISVHVSLNNNRESLLRIIPGLEEKLKLDVHMYTESDDDIYCRHVRSSSTQIF